MNIETEVLRLQELRGLREAAAVSIVKSREAASKCVREIGETYIQHALDPNPIRPRKRRRSAGSWKRSERQRRAKSINFRRR